MKNSEFGFLYYSIGIKYLDEAINSAKSVRKYMKDCKIAIFTNNEGKNYLDSGLFDQILIAEQESFSFCNKIVCLSRTPFSKTLFIDTDTELISPIYELIPLLEKFDLCVCHAPVRKTFQVEDCPDSFPECNCGMILYNKTENVLSFFNSWYEICKLMYEQNSGIHDQPSFRKSLFESELRYYILPPEYNTRTIYPYFKGGNMKTKILHGSPGTIAKAKKTINSSPSIRTGNFNNIGLLRILKKYTGILLKNIK